jgi:hypothetical protein
MLNHKEIMEALLAGKTLVDLNDKEITLRLDEDSVVDQNSIYKESIHLLDWEVKPRTININGYEVPEPIRVKPSLGDKFYTVYLSADTVECFIFGDSMTCNRWFNQGLAHKTREAAELHLKALLSFTALTNEEIEAFKR